MIHKAKALGLAVIAVLAMSAVIAQAAQAAPFFHSEVEPTIITGEQIGEQKFVTSGGTVKCKQAKFTGTQATKTTTTVTLKPSYSECTAFGFVGATVDTNSCGYEFHLVEGSSPPTALSDVECSTAGDKIKVTAGSCTTEVGPQKSLAHVVFSNTGTGSTRDIDANVTIEGITYTESSGCFAPGTRSNGTLTGSATVKGYEDINGVEGAQVGIWVE